MGTRALVRYYGGENEAGKATPMPKGTVCVCVCVVLVGSVGLGRVPHELTVP